MQEMMMVQTFAILLITIISSISAERILVLFCHTGPSHFYSFYQLFDLFAKRGHNVTVLTYNHVENHHKNYNELLLSGLSAINSSIKYEHMVSRMGHCDPNKESNRYGCTLHIHSGHLIAASSQCT